MTLKRILSALGSSAVKSFKRPDGKKYILLIEDDSDLMEMYKMKLEREGFFCSSFS